MVSAPRQGFFNVFLNFSLSLILYYQFQDIVQKKRAGFCGKNGLVGLKVMALLLPIQLAVKIRTPCSCCSAYGVRSKLAGQVCTSNGGGGRGDVDKKKVQEATQNGCNSERALIYSGIERWKSVSKSDKREMSDNIRVKLWFGLGMCSV
jgi:hypothetical protein